MEKELEGDTKTLNCSPSPFPIFFRIKASCLSRVMNNRVQNVLRKKKKNFLHYSTSALYLYIHLVTLKEALQKRGFALVDSHNLRIIWGGF